MFNPLLFIEHPDCLLLSQRMCAMLTGRVVSMGIIISGRKFLSSKVPHYIHYTKKAGGIAGGRAGKERMEEGIFKASAPHFRIYSLVPGPIASLF